MPIIDRYLLRQFFQTYLICFCSLTGLYIVIDGFGNLDDFMGYKHGSLLSVMGQYYAYRSLPFFEQTSGLLSLIAAMFTVTWIQRHNELTALEAAGISRARVVAPMIGAVVLISLVSAANREFMIPSVRDRLSHNAQDLEGNTAKVVQPRCDNETDIYIGGARTFANQQRIEKPNFRLPANLGQYGKSIVGANAFYRPPAPGRPGGYLFDGVTQPRNFDAVPSLALAGQLIVITPRDATWLKPGQCFVVSGISFEQLEAADSWLEFSSTAELMRGLRNPSLDFGADVRVAIHGRLVQPFLDVTLLFLGLPLVLSHKNRNVFAAIGLCGAIVLAFNCAVLSCQYLGTAYWISPAMAAWLPLLIFVPCAVSLSESFSR